jgi:FKBP-type peptidyl-prolyl cis-trans isomerase FklB
MKKAMILLLAALCSQALDAQELNTSADSISYALGVMWAQSLKSQGFTNVDFKKAEMAINDVLAGKPGALDIKAANTLVKDYVKRSKEAAGKQFLAENKKRKEVTTLPSGLQYEVMKEGTGPMPKATDKVKVHYHGTLIDGTVFDSSVQRGEPAVFGVTQVIKGWVEALQLMKVGTKWKIFLPHELAYGERGAGGQIGPYSTLVFEVELLGIE